MPYDESRAPVLRGALARVQREASSPDERSSAAFWNALIEVKQAEGGVSLSFLKEQMPSFNRPPPAQTDNARWSTDAADLLSKLKTINTVNERITDPDRRQYNKLILEMEELNLAPPDPSRANFQSISQLYDRVSERPNDSPRNAALLLNAAQLYAVIGTASRAVKASVAITQLQRAISKAAAYWSRHPAILSADQTVVTIAAGAGLNVEATPSLNRLGANPDNALVFVVDPYQLSEDAFTLGGWSVGRGWLLAALKVEASEKSPTTSDQWADVLQSRVGLLLVTTAADTRINVLTAILADPELAPRAVPLEDGFSSPWPTPTPTSAARRQP